MEKIRLDKIVADMGFGTRSEAARLIRDGDVLVDGRVASSGAEKYDPAISEITVGGTRLVYKKLRYFMMNKPAGVVSATEDRKEATVLDLMTDGDRRLGLFPAGRLDKDAEGLLLLTNDGDLVHRIISPSKNIWKTYYVETLGALGIEDAAALKTGVVLRDGLRCLPAVLEIISAGETSTASVRIREGKYHQVKRMLASRGKPVTYLKRLSIGGLELDSALVPGSYREMTREEVESVFDESRSPGLEIS
jgi:16S rRNA pseudouridine516 synthase